MCLIPTTIGGLLPAIGIAGMNRALSANVLAKSGKAVEVAGDVDVLLLDKTGTITHGDRQATVFHPLAGVDASRLRDAALLSSLADPTPEGKSIVKLAREQGSKVADPEPDERNYLQFTAQTRMSGVDLTRRQRRAIRKGAGDAIMKHVQALGAVATPELAARIDQVARSGATPLVVAEGKHVLGVVELSDVVKHGVEERFARLRAMGVRTVMITGDNPLTAAAIAAEAGVDDYIAEATPEDKLARIRSEQAQGRLVAMVGDGTNDAPALAQADVGLAMNSGTQAAKEAGNMVDLDSDPAKLLAVVGDRQAAADHPRRADHVLAGQRRVEVLRDPAGDLRRGDSVDGGAQRDAAVEPDQRRAGGADLQRADHSRADPAGFARRALQARQRRIAVAPEHADLWRRRRASCRSSASS